MYIPRSQGSLVFYLLLRAHRLLESFPVLKQSKSINISCSYHGNSLISCSHPKPMSNEQMQIEVHKYDRFKQECIYNNKCTCSVDVAEL